MKALDIQKLSSDYDVRRLGQEDAEMIFALCQKNTQYYAYCGMTSSLEQIEQDLRVPPPGIPKEQKYYVGFFENGELAAVMDLIDGYPTCAHAFIGFFMLGIERQGRGIGSRIINETLEHLREIGFEKCQLGIDKGNPQSSHFWRKNGFVVIREVEMGIGTILLAEREV